MPDKWEYPWYAAWDLAFHAVALALVDPDFAKEQLMLMLREWYMHPNGQLPAYEWAFGDVNPPVHAWAAWRVYKIEKKRRGAGDTKFLERVFHKLLLNFTWWVNRKDAEGSNVFEGGFLGLDNIGVFDRSKPLPTGGTLQQSDGTSWMAMYSLNLLAMAMELAAATPRTRTSPASSGSTSSTSRTPSAITAPASPVSGTTRTGSSTTACGCPTARGFPLKIRSMVGLIPLFAVETIEPEMLDRLPGFKRRLEWFIDYRPDLTENVACMRTPGRGERRLLSVVTADRLQRVLQYMLDEQEFLSPYGIRALSRVHKEHPYVLSVNGFEHRVDYEPGESATGAFGGNSNWRGPIWFPVNYLIIESLQKYHHYFGDSVKVECPTGSGRMLTLSQVAAELSRRLSSLFLRDASGRRPGIRRRLPVPAGPALERPAALLRVLPRRHRPRRRREPSDRMDRPRRQAAPAERRTSLRVEHGQPAVDEVGRAGHVVAVRRGEEHGETGDVAGLTEPRQRNLPRQCLELHRVVQQLRVDRRLDRARRDVVDRDAQRAKFHGERPRQHPESALARARMERSPGTPDPRAPS